MKTRLSQTHSYSLTVCGIISTFLYGCLAWASHNPIDFITLLSILFPAAIVTFSYWLYSFHSNTQPLKSHIIFWAIIFRFIGVIGAPILEDDYFRYLWDGYMLVEYGSPYGIPPSAFFDADNLSDELSDVLDGVNHPDIATIYGPVCQLIFGLAYLLSPAQVWLLQAFSAVFDIAVIILLAKITSPRNLLLYAWCPLLIKEFAFTAHTDIFAIFFVVAAYYAMLQERWRYMGVLLAFALASKIFALLALPFLLLRNRKSWLPFISCLILLYLPFIKDIINTNHGLTAMANGWVFNAPLYYLAYAMTPISEWYLKGILASVLAVFTAYRLYFWHSTKLSTSIHLHWIYAVFLLVLPVVNPWYLVWVLAFATIKPYACLWVSSVAILLSYAIGLNLEDSNIQAYQQPNWALILESSLILTAGIFDVYYRRKQQIPNTE